MPERQRVFAVSGASGFVGQALLRSLAETGGVARGLYRSAPQNPNPTAFVTGDLGGTPILGDALAGVQVVIHTAARTHVLADREADPLEAYRRINVTGTMKLARTAASAGVRRFVYLSSIKVNGERTPIDQPFSETSAPAPEDAYGQTKWEAELALGQLSRETGLELVVLRPPLVHGPGAKGNLHRLMRLVDRGVPLPFGSIHNRRSMIGIGNLVSGIMAAAIHSAAPGRTFLVSDADALSTADLIRAIADGLGKPARLLPFPPGLLAAAGNLLGHGAEIERLTGSLRVDGSAIRDTVGWSPATSAADGIRQMARAFRQT